MACTYRLNIFSLVKKIHDPFCIPWWKGLEKGWKQVKNLPENLFTLPPIAEITIVMHSLIFRDTTIMLANYKSKNYILLSSNADTIVDSFCYILSVNGALHSRAHTRQKDMKKLNSLFCQRTRAAAAEQKLTRSILVFKREKYFSRFYKLNGCLLLLLLCLGDLGPYRLRRFLRYPLNFL